MIGRENRKQNYKMENSMKPGAIKLCATFFLTACLSGCLGGGGSSTNSSTPPPPVASTLSFPFQGAYLYFIANGSNGNFTISGDCSGTGSRHDAPAGTATIFESTLAFSAVGIISQSYSNCTPTPVINTYTNYYDTNYTPLGYSDGVYGVFLMPAVLPPTSAMVGDSGTMGTETLFTDSTKTVGVGKKDFSYKIEEDTADSAIVNLVTETYDTGGTLTVTEQDRYRITGIGELVPVSTDIQYVGGSPAHLVWTYN